MFLIGEKLVDRRSSPAAEQLFLWLPPTTERGGVARAASRELLVGVAWEEPEDEEGVGLRGGGCVLGPDILILDNYTHTHTHTHACTHTHTHAHAHTHTHTHTCTHTHTYAHIKYTYTKHYS